MAVYKIYPTKDATIYSYYPERNTGLDEIVEASTTPSEFLDTGNPQTSRFLIQFSNTDINNVLNNLANGASYEARLKLYAANVTNLSGTTVVECYAVSGSWNNGTGKLFDNPATTNGVSWTYRSSDTINPWPSESFASGSTGSFDTQPGGGVWYTSTSLKATQTLQYSNPIDLDLDVTPIVAQWKATSIPNEGFILKQQQEFVNNVTNAAQLKYYSIDTNTIYPPCLELRWADAQIAYQIPPVITGSSVYVSLDNNTGLYRQGSVQTFRVNTRPYYPGRVFQTTSLYTNQYSLPYSSYYAVQDLNTNEMVVDFSETYTRLSIDNLGSYFKLYMAGLEPERYYKILIKSTIDGSTLVIDNNFLFKVLN